MQFPNGWLTTRHTVHSRLRVGEKHWNRAARDVIRVVIRQSMNVAASAMAAREVR
jgi:hypothetical protein